MPDKGPLFAQILPGMRQRFGGGRLAPPGTIAYAENARFRRGRVEKRGGSEQLGVSPTGGGASWPTAQQWLADGYCAVDDALYAYDEDAGTWTTAGRDTPITPVRRWPALFSDDDTLTYVTCAQFGDSVIVAGSTQATAGSSSSVLIRSFTRDGVPRKSVELSARCMPRLLVSESGTELYLFWLNSAGVLSMRQISEALVETGSTYTTGTTPTNYDVCVIPSQSPDAICIAEHAGGNVTMRRIAGVTQTHSSSVVSVGTALVALDASTVVHLAFVNNTGVRWSPHSSALISQNSAATTIVASSATVLHNTSSALAVKSESAAISYVAWGEYSAGTTPSSSAVRLGIARLDTVGAVVSSNTATPDWVVSSRFYPTRGVGGSDLFLLARNGAGRCAHMRWPISGTDLGAGQIVGHVFDRDTVEGDNSNLAGSLALDARLDLDTTVNPRSIYVGIPWYLRASQRAADVLAFSERGATSFSHGRARQLYEIGPARYIGGGAAILQPNTTPGSTSFPTRPLCEGISNIPTIWIEATAGAGLTTGQAYSYKAVYEHANEYGERVRSEPSAAVSVTPSGANLRATVRILVPGGTYRPNLIAHLYRSWLGGPYYRVTPDSGAPVLTLNDGGVVATTTVDYVDSMADASAAARERLYTDFGYLPNAPASGARIVTEGGGRLFAVDNLDRIRFSKLYIPNEPIQFVDDPTFMIVPPRRPTGLAYLDGTVVVFSERGIHLVSGDGPDDRGQGIFSEPRALPTDDGCIEPRSVLVTSAGVLYQSRRGIMLLPRGFGPPIWVGEDCQETLRSFPVIQGACRSSAQGAELAHFHVAASETPGYGCVLVFDVSAGTWAADRMTPAGHDSVVAIGPWYGDFGFAYLGTVPRRIRDDGTRYSDLNGVGATYFQSTTIRLAELRPFGEIGYGVVTELVVMGEFTDECSVSIATNLDEGVTLTDSSQPETRTWTTVPASAGKVVYLRVVPTHGNGTALAVTLSDAEGLIVQPDSAGMAWYALGVDARPQGGLRRAGYFETK